MAAGAAALAGGCSSDEGRADGGVHASPDSSPDGTAEAGAPGYGRIRLAFEATSEAHVEAGTLALRELRLPSERGSDVEPVLDAPGVLDLAREEVSFEFPEALPGTYGSLKLTLDVDGVPPALAFEVRKDERRVAVALELVGQETFEVRCPVPVVLEPGAELVLRLVLDLDELIECLPERLPPPLDGVSTVSRETAPTAIDAMEEVLLQAWVLACPGGRDTGEDHSHANE